MYLLAILILSTLASALTTTPALSQPQPTVVNAGVSYEFLTRWDIAKLNHILNHDSPQFSATATTYTPARNAVKLYRVTYTTVVPELGNKPTIATGLIAIPDVNSSEFPLVSYQHGTVYGKEHVPSFPDQSPETQLMIAQFAGQGYILIGADYFGLGRSNEPEGYMVKQSHQQATFDMLKASTEILTSLGIKFNQLFLSGWSQGGFVTLSMLEKLQQNDISVTASATASAPTDVFAVLNGFLSFPRQNDADWITTLFILSAFSFEHYYSIPGLARSLINDEFYDISRRAYERQPIDVNKIPTNLNQLIRPEYFNTQYFAESVYGRLVAKTHAYRWVIKSPVRFYYGESDEAIRTEIGLLPMYYQQAIGNTSTQAISTGATSHRGTFAVAVPQWKQWFDSMLNTAQKQ